VSLKELARKTSLLPEIKNYLHGYRHTLTGLPNEIVLFARYSSSQFTLSSRGICHHRYNLIMSFSGNLSISVDGQIITLEEGRAFLLFPFQTHHYLAEKIRAICWLYAGFELVEKAPDTLKYRTVDINSDMEKYTEDLLTAALSADNNTGNEQAARRIACNLGLLLNAMPDAEKSEEPKISKHPPLISRILALLAENPGSLSIDEISGRTGYSPGYIKAVFKKHTGLGPAAYSRELRILRALRYIACEKTNISRAAELCGFDSVYSFSRACRRHTGHAPGYFRKKN